MLYIHESVGRNKNYKPQLEVALVFVRKLEEVHGSSKRLEVNIDEHSNGVCILSIFDHERDDDITIEMPNYETVTGIWDDNTKEIANYHTEEVEYLWSQVEEWLEREDDNEGYYKGGGL